MMFGGTAKDLEECQHQCQSPFQILIIWKTHEEFLPSFGGEQEHSLGEGPRTDFMVFKSSGVMTILRNEIGEQK